MLTLVGVLHLRDNFSLTATISICKCKTLFAVTDRLSLTDLGDRKSRTKQLRSKHYQAIALNFSSLAISTLSPEVRIT